MTYQITKLKCVSTRLAIVFAQFIESQVLNNEGAELEQRRHAMLHATTRVYELVGWLVIEVEYLYSAYSKV